MYIFHVIGEEFFVTFILVKYDHDRSKRWKFGRIMLQNFMIDLMLWSQVEVKIHKDYVLGIVPSIHSISTIINCNINKYILK